MRMSRVRVSPGLKVLYFCFLFVCVPLQSISHKEREREEGFFFGDVGREGRGGREEGGLVGWQADNDK